VELNSIIGDIYEAGADDANWRTVGARLFKYLGADAGSLRLQAGGGRSINVFEAHPESDHYADHYLSIDPIRAALLKVTPGPDGEAVLLDDELVDGAQYRLSEFYCDFARPNGQEHMLVGVVGDCDRSNVGFFRQGVAFGIRERNTLSSLLPHVRRALQLRQRLHRAEFESKLGYAMFDALPGAAIVVDADCNVLFANAVATKSLSRRDQPISLVTALGSGTRLVIDNRSDASRLRFMVRDASVGGAGGAIRVEFDCPGSDRVCQYAVLVSPQPSGGAEEFIERGRVPVLVLIDELSTPRAAKPSLLSDLFGLSAAEGAVAAALLGGQSAETVARDRDVSLDTVRTQIRTVLRKSNAANLRDFERIGALLGSLSR
jgi:DNA-binding CsgD family transcriptional regulator